MSTVVHRDTVTVGEAFLAMVESRAGHREEARRAFTQFVETAPKSSYAADIVAARQALAQMGSK